MAKKKVKKKKKKVNKGKHYKIDNNTTREEFQEARQDLFDFLTKRY
jgi:hypothetical protein